MAQYNYLDKNGLLYLWAKLKATFATISSVPTAVSQLTNDSNYQTGTQVSTAIAQAVGSIATIQFQIVSQLPTTGSSNIVYLVPATSGTNTYDEYIYVNNAWEQIGTTACDLTGYVQASDLVAITNAEIDVIVAN